MFDNHDRADRSDLPPEPHAPKKSQGPVSNEQLDANLTRLLRDAYHPPRPSDTFQMGLRDRLIDRQRQGLGPRLARWPIAVAALFLIGLTVAFVALRNPEPTPMAPGFFHCATGESSWRRVGPEHPVQGGDRVALAAAERVTVTRPDQTRFELEEQSLLSLAGSDRETTDQLSWGAATVRSPNHHVLETPILRVVSRHAEYRILVSHSPPVVPVTEEYLQMNHKKIVAGAVAVGVIVFVSILMIDGDPGDVAVELDGETHPLTVGESREFQSPSDHSVATNDPVETNLERKSSEERTTEESDSSTPAAVAIEGTREIHGQVVNRANNPLEDARVTFELRVEDTDSDRPSGAVIGGPVSTDETGAFQLRVADDAIGDIVVRRSRYEDGRAPWQAPDLDASIPGSTEDGSHEVGGNETKEQDSEEHSIPESEDPAEPIVIVLEHETAFSGVVTQAENGEPLSEFLLGYQRFEDGWRWFEPVVRASSSETGEFYAGGLNPGKYRVWIYQPGYCRSESLVVELARHEYRQDLEIALRPGVGLSAKVYSKRTGTPVTDAVVYSHLEHIPGTVHFVRRTEVDERLRNAAKTDGAGFCQLEDLSPGSHHIRILHPDYAPLEKILTLEPGDSPELEFTLDEGPAIFGSVIDASGEPVVGAEIFAITMTMRQDLSSISEGKTDEEGKYTINNLNPGPYIVVRVNPENESDTKVSMSTLMSGKDQRVDFIELARLATLKGRVVDQNGDPMADMSVTASVIDAKSGFKFESSLTNEEGRFEIKNLEFKEYTISVAKNFSYSFAVVGQEKIEEAIDYQAEYVVYDLEIEGKVTSSTGNALPNVEVIVLRFEAENANPTFAGRGVTNDEGEYLIGELKPGHYLLYVSGEDLAPGISKDFELDSEERRVQKHDFELQVGAGVQVTVVDNDGFPLADTEVKLIDAGGERVNEGFPPLTDTNGVYSFRRLAPGPHSVAVIREGWKPGAASFEAVASTQSEVRITMEREE